MSLPRFLQQVRVWYVQQLRLDGHVGRFPVGQAVSNGPLFVLTSTICKYCMRVHCVDAQQLVDNLMTVLRMRGLNGTCPICLEALERALETMAFFDKMMKDRDFEYSDKEVIHNLHCNLHIR